MPRSRTNTKGRPVAAALLFFSLAFPLHAAPKAKPYHLELEANPATPFAYLARFGTVDLHVYPGGVRAESFWLNGFSANGTKTITVINPVLRMYTDVPIADVRTIVTRLAGSDVVQTGPPLLQGPFAGKVGTLRASRYRLVYGENAWIDFWTTTEMPENPQLRTILANLVSVISEPTGKVVQAIPGTAVYVELNFRRFKKVPLLKLKKITWTSAGEADALRVGSYYFRAPLLDAVWR